ncbi:chorismate synthase [Bacteroidia bacterium]|nr:chorismate synthase [Bacteroidia bacterium]
MIFGNSFGDNIQVTTFGESHGKCIGAVIEGFPANINVDVDIIQDMLDIRKPSNHVGSTSRKEPDKIEILSGVLNGTTLGTPIAFIIKNTNQHSDDYENLKNIFRPGHADFSYFEKYGIYDYRGGGRASARNTASIVAAGGFAKQLIFQHFNNNKQPKLNNNDDIENTKNISVIAKLIQVGNATNANDIENLLQEVKLDGDSIGGMVECTITNLPAGIGEPVFAKLQAMLAYAMLSIPAAKGFEYGHGFDSIFMHGSENNDSYTACTSDNTFNTPSNCSSKITSITPRTNNAGGILGGISTGLPITFRVAFKPIASIAKQQQTVDNNGKKTNIKIKGRHDVCCAVRAVPVVEAMVYLVLADLIEHL